MRIHEKKPSNKSVVEVPSVSGLRSSVSGLRFSFC